MKNIALLFFLLCLSTPLFAQDYTGRILDANTREPLAFANVVALASDSTMIQGTTSNDDGTFIISTNNAKLLYISYIGYSPLTLQIGEWHGGDVLLQPNANSIDEITVTASRPTFKLERGSITAEVQGTYLNRMGQATDVIGQMPLVSANADSDISVWGRGTPEIYINNRKVTNQQELSRLKANNIKSITVINNPGVEYGSKVKAVIKIETIKPTGDGLSGWFNTSVTQNNALSWSTSADLNYRTGNVDIFGDIIYGHTNRKQSIENSYGIIGDNTYRSNDSSAREIASKYVETTLGVNYTPNAHTSMGIRYNFEHTPSDLKKTKAQSQLHLNDILLDSCDIQSENIKTEQSTSHHVNAYHNGAIDEIIEWSLNADMLLGNSGDEQHATDKYLGHNRTEELHSTGKQQYNLTSARLVLSAPIWIGTLMGGGEFAHTNNKQQFDVSSSDSLTPLGANNNHARQTQWAAFLMYNLFLGENMDVELGIRYENTNFEYLVDGLLQANPRYNDPFPMLGFNFYTDVVDASLSYKRTVDRPSYYQLRNSTQYNSPYSYEAGNPYLLPTIVNQFSLLVQLKKPKITLSADYYNSEDASILIPRPLSDRAAIMRFENFDRYNTLALAANYAPRIGIWRPNMEIGWTKNFFEYQGQSFNKPIFEAKTRSIFELHKTLQLGITLSYRTSGHSEVDYVHSQLNLNTYLTARLFNERLQLTLRGLNLLNTPYEYHRNINNVDTHLINHLNGRGISFSASYNFNATKSKYKGEDSSDEIYRL